ncbi:MAG: ECF transporter S component [Chloroflexota bacterium]
MNIRAASLRAPFPRVLRYTDVRSYLLTASFVLLGVAAPWGFHQFHLAGATYLPMHLFALGAGLAFGWRAGLVTGLLTPLASFTISGMPTLAILPQAVVEIAAYGLLAGWLAEKCHLKVVWSLLGAMAGGRLALLIFLVSTYLINGQSYGPLGPEAGPLGALGTAVRLGWPGMVLQLTLLPLAFRLAAGYAARHRAQ